MFSLSLTSTNPSVTASKATQGELQATLRGGSVGGEGDGKSPPKPVSVASACPASAAQSKFEQSVIAQRLRAVGVKEAASTEHHLAGLSLGTLSRALGAGAAVSSRGTEKNPPICDALVCRC